MKALSCGAPKTRYTTRHNMKKIVIQCMHPPAAEDGATQNDIIIPYCAMLSYNITWQIPSGPQRTAAMLSSD